MVRERSETGKDSHSKIEDRKWKLSFWDCWFWLLLSGVANYILKKLSKNSARLVD
jgi:hypothetical protein